MDSHSIYNWILVLILSIIVFSITRRLLGGKNKQESINASSKSDLLTKVQFYSSQGFQTVIDRGSIVVMSKRQKFNWALCIFLLFIPLIGWLALLVILFGKKDNIHSITIAAPE